jgi:hypothetical protein
MIPTFQVNAGSNIDLALTFDCIAAYSVTICDWNGTTWVPRNPALVPNGHSAGGAATHALGNVPVATTILVVVPVEMTSATGDSEVSTSALVKQGATVEGELDTPTVTPGSDEAADVIMRMLLRGV